MNFEVYQNGKNLEGRAYVVSIDLSDDDLFDLEMSNGTLSLEITEDELKNLCEECNKEISEK